MKGLAPISVGILLLSSLAHAAPPELELIQPVQSKKGVLLVNAPHRATVERPSGEPQEISLRTGERLTELVETRRGWVAAGVRATKRGRRELVVVMEDAAGVERLTLPGRQKGRLRILPTLLLEDEEFSGIAWLEGDDFRSLSVRFAEWSGAGWGPVKKVSRPGRGSQTGLVGTELRDGSHLLVWSAYDGDDDEIVWSRRRGSRWSRPKRLTANNRTPDTMPAVVSMDGGAVAVWSHYDGEDYRLMSARFDGRKWKRPEIIGPAGSLDPRFVELDTGLFLTYQNAWPAGWSVVQVGRQGEPTRRAVVRQRPDQRPMVAQPGNREVTLLWPQQNGVHTVEWERLP
ncbi:MAG: hypothetical protein WBG93_10990 [Thermoanaerobaculia bacterium]